MSEAGDGTVELLAPVLCRCRSRGTSSQLDEAQHNVKLLASWWARLAVWCSSLTRGAPAGTAKT